MKETNNNTTKRMFSYISGALGTMISIFGIYKMFMTKEVMSIIVLLFGLALIGLAVYLYIDKFEGDKATFEEDNVGIHGQGTIPMNKKELDDFYEKNDSKEKMFKKIDWNNYSFKKQYEEWQSILKSKGLDQKTFYSINFEKRRKEILNKKDYIKKENYDLYQEYYINKKQLFDPLVEYNPKRTLSNPNTQAFLKLENDYSGYSERIKKTINREIEQERREIINSKNIDFIDILEKNNRHIPQGGPILNTYKTTTKQWPSKNNGIVDLTDSSRNVKNYDIKVCVENWHGYFLGASGSGKTQTAIGPMLLTMSIAKDKINLNYDKKNQFLDSIQKFNLEEFIKKDTKNGTYDFLNFFKDDNETGYVSEVLKMILTRPWIKEIEEDQNWYNRFRIKFDIENGKIKGAPYVIAPTESIIVNDVKGELTDMFSGIFAASGHNVLALDYNDAFASNKFNQFSIFVKPFKEMVIAELEKKTFEEENKKILEDLNSEDRHLRDNAKSIIGTDLEELNINCIKTKDSFSKMFELVSGLISGETENKSTTGKDSEWTTMAHEAIQGMIMYGLMKFVCPVITQQYYNTIFNKNIIDFEQEQQVDLIDQFTIASIKSFYSRCLQGGSGAQYTTAQKRIIWEINGPEYGIVEGKDEPEQTYKGNDIVAFNDLWSFIDDGTGPLTKLVSYLSNAENTKKSINSSIDIALSKFDLIKSMEETTEVDLTTIFTHKATAIFLKTPWSRGEMKSFPQLILSSIITQLEGKASTYNKGRLPVRCNLILDEMPNMAAIPMLDNIVSLARSYMIRLIAITQSDDQLEQVYSKEMLSILKQNCALQYYLKSYDAGTNDSVSKRIGETTIRVKQDKQATNSSGKKEITSDYRFEGRALILANELAKLPLFEQVVSLTLLQNQSIYTKGALLFEMENSDYLEDLTKYYVRKEPRVIGSFNPRFENWIQFDNTNGKSLKWSYDAFKTSDLFKDEIDLTLTNTKIIR